MGFRVPMRLLVYLVTVSHSFDIVVSSVRAPNGPKGADVPMMEVAIKYLGGFQFLLDLVSLPPLFMY